MRYGWMLFFCFCGGPLLFSQVKIGDHPNQIHANSLMELESSSKVLVVTRLSNSQMQNLVPLPGAVIYNTNTHCLHYYAPNGWQNLCEIVPGITVANNGDGSFSITGPGGQQITFNGAPETTSTLEDEGNGKYTYTNELGQKTTISLTGSGSGSFSGDFNDLTNVPFNLDIDSTDDFDGNWTNLANRPTGLDDGDDDTTYSAGNGLTLSGTTFAVDNSALTLDWSNLSNIPTNLDLDSTDDFDGNWSSLTNRPAGLDDGDDDTTYSAGSGLTLSGTTFAVDNSALTLDWSNLTNVPTNLDTDSTDDFDGDWANLSNVPTNLDIDSTDDFSGDFDDLSNVPLNLDVDSTDDFDGDWSSLSNRPAGLDDGDDDTTYSAGSGLTLSGTTFAVDNSSLAIDWSNLANRPTGLDDGDDDTTYSAGSGLTLTGATFAVDNSTLSLDWSNLSNIPANLDTDSTDDFDGDWANLSNVPTNLDTDSTDDFDGDWTSISNRPTGLDDGDDDTTYSAGSGLTLTGTTFAVDNSSLTIDWSNLSNIPTNLDTDSTNDFSGDFSDLSNVPLNLDIDSSDDFDGDWISLTNRPAGLDDGDDDTTYSAGSGLTLSGTTFAVDNSALTLDWSNLTNVPTNLDTDSSDDFDGDWANLSNVPTNLDIDSTDDFDGNWTSLSNRPAGLDDGDDDTTYSAGSGLTLTGTTFAVDNSALTLNWSNVSNIPTNLDLDSTDDFDGNWTSLTARPAGLDDGDDDTTYSAGSGLTLTGTTFALDNSALTLDWGNLTNVPANLDTDSTNDFDGDWTSISNRPAGLDDGDDDTTYSAGSGLTLAGTTFAVDNSSLTIDWGNLTNIPTNLDLDGTDDFDGDWTSISNRPTGLDDGDDDTTYSAGSGLTLSGTTFAVDISALTLDWSNISNIPTNLDTDSTDDFDGDWTSLANRPAGLDDGDDDTTYSAGSGLTLTGTTFAVDNSSLAIDWGNLTNVPLNLDVDRTNDFDGNWTSLTNRPIGLDDGDDDTTYTAGSGLTLTGTTFAVDNSSLTLDWSNLSNIPTNLDTDSTNDFSGDFNDLSNVPLNLDIDSSDDFDGDWISLTNRPAGLDDGDDDTTYSAGSGLTLTGTTFAVDNSSLTLDWGNLSNIPTNLDTDSTDDFDGDWTSLANRPTGLDDGDDDTTYSAGSGLTLTGTTFAVDNSSLAIDWGNISNMPTNLDTDSTNDFSGDFNDLVNVPLNLDIDSTDDFDGDWSSLANRPIGLDDGDDDTTYTAGSGLTLTGTTFALDNSALTLDWSNVSNIPTNLDTDSTDDFDGAWTSLSNRPTGLDDGDDDTTYFAGSGLTLTGTTFAVDNSALTLDWSNVSNIPTNLDTDSTNDFSGDFDDLSNVPLNLDIDSTDDFDGEWTSLSNRPTGLDDGDDDNQTATEVSYTNTSSGLSATTVQGAVDELATRSPFHALGKIASNASIQNGMNISGSIVHSATGVYRVNFTTPASSANYIIQTTLYQPGNAAHIMVMEQSTTHFTIHIEKMVYSPGALGIAASVSHVLTDSAWYFSVVDF